MTLQAHERVTGTAGRDPPAVAVEPALEGTPQRGWRLQRQQSGSTARDRRAQSQKSVLTLGITSGYFSRPNDVLLRVGVRGYVTWQSALISMTRCRGRGMDPTVSGAYPSISPILSIFSSGLSVAVLVLSSFLCLSLYVTSPQRNLRLPFSVQTDKSTSARTVMSLQRDTALRDSQFFHEQEFVTEGYVISKTCNMFFFSSDLFRRAPCGCASQCFGVS